MGMKQSIYDFLVRKNVRVHYEYERYVQENITEHYTNRLRHWALLWRLNWHYRVKKSDEPMLYFDKPQNALAAPIQQNAPAAPKPQNAKNYSKSKELLKFPESTNTQNMPKSRLINKLLEFDVISFDLFDTLVFRYIDDPKDLFWLVGGELRIPNYKRIRTDIENEIRKLEKHGEITIDDIYDVVAERFGINKESGVEIEVGYEQKICFANPYMFEVYNELKKHNKKIIVTSNMYLRKEQLKKILTNCGYGAIEDIFVSCEYKANKRNGALQKIISEELGNCSVIHIGDNYVSDIEGSRSAGWKAIYYENVNQAGKEYRPKGMSVFTGGIYKGLVNTTLHNGNKLDPYYEYGYAYVGYLAYGFCKWLNELAKVKGIDKFLFFARDMQIIYEAYTKYFNQVDSEYSMGSRTASIHLAFDTHIEYFYDWHINRRINRNLQISQVLEDICMEYLLPELAECGLSPNEILTNDNADKMLKLIRLNKSTILNTYAEEKAAAEKYYLDVIGDAKNVCMVDLGWKASSSHSLESFFNYYCDTDTNFITALIGTEGHEFVDILSSTGKVFPYVFSSQLNTELMRTHNANGFIWRRLYEISFTSTEQSLHKFALNENGDVELVYFKKEVRESEIVENIHQGILDFVRDYAQVEKLLNKNLTIYSHDAYKPMSDSFRNAEYNMELFGGFEVRLLVGKGQENDIELLSEVVKREGK